MSEVRALSTDGRVAMTITAPVRKLCPVKNEVDEGTVTIRVRTTQGETLELHSLAEYLETFANRHLLHEDFVTEIADALGVDVSSTWTTAGMEVTCEVLRQSVDPADS